MSDAFPLAPRPHTGLASHFLRWYWVERPAEIIRLYTAYASAFGSMFSIIYLLKTFAAPWKSIQDAYPSKGLNISAILETLTLNMTARVIGMVVRSGAMFAGLLLQLIVLVSFTAYVFLWIALPLLLIGGGILLTLLF